MQEGRRGGRGGASQASLLNQEPPAPPLQTPRFFSAIFTLDRFPRVDSDACVLPEPRNSAQGAPGRSLHPNAAWAAARSAQRCWGITLRAPCIPLFSSSFSPSSPPSTEAPRCHPRPPDKSLQGQRNFEGHDKAPAYGPIPQMFASPAPSCAPRAAPSRGVAGSPSLAHNLPRSPITSPIAKLSVARAEPRGPLCVFCFPGHPPPPPSPPQTAPFSS